MKDFNDRVAVVTGAASGIGRGMVENFVKLGMKAVLADIDADRLNITLKSFKDSGANVIGIPTDVSDPEQVRELGRQAHNTFGKVHVLCNNAGVGYGGRNSWEVPLEGWSWVLGVNLMGVINGIHTFMPIMLAQDDEAHIVNTASAAGIIMNAWSVPYGVSKHAVVALSESLHLELKNRASKVKVSVLCPGPVNTDIMHSSERLRPNSVPPPPELTKEEEIFRKAYELWIERGLDPREVGRQVVEAIREERFYILPHDFSNYVESRLKNILGSKNPEPMLPPQDLAQIVQEIIGS
jgi:NAD(P)-dependent dehydrogenase (short-subunit alcohol dehydrogenase family)